jgi:hypothetical protein
MYNSSEVLAGQMTQLCMLGALIGLVPAIIAHNKGLSFLGWWVFGAALFILALPLAIVAKPYAPELERRALSSGGRKCPHCAEIIKSAAVVCRYCGRDVAPAQVSGGGAVS